MKLENFNQALAIGLEMYETLKKCNDECQKKGVTLIDEYEDQYFKARDFFGEVLPKYVYNNKIKGEDLAKVIKLTMKSMHYITISDWDNLEQYFNKETMQNQSILKEAAEACITKDQRGDYINRFYLEIEFRKYNFAYFEKFILANADIDEATKFAIEYKTIPDLHQKQFEKRVLNEGKFKNLYDYLFEVKDCNQKAFLTKILEIATPEELKQFSIADKIKERIQKARSDAYSDGYSMGYDPY